MEQCGAVVVGPRELDLVGHGGRRKEGEGGKVARQRALGPLCRPESTWARLLASGGGRFGPGRLDGERAERVGGELHGGAAWRLGSAPRTRVSVGRCQGAGQVAPESSPGSTWPRTRHGRGPPAAYGGRRAKQRKTERGDEDEGLFVISKNSGTAR